MRVSLHVIAKLLKVSRLSKADCWNVDIQYVLYIHTTKYDGGHEHFVKLIKNAGAG